jgi:hypothetical protein
MSGMTWPILPHGPQKVGQATVGIETLMDAYNYTTVFGIFHEIRVFQERNKRISTQLAHMVPYENKWLGQEFF